jgi:hypothetical protein
MPGLLRGVARTAVIAGTATTVSNRVSRRQGNRWAQQDAEAAAQQDQYEQQPPPVAAAAPPSDDPIARIRELAALRDQGILTDEEFASAKAKLLT